MRLNISFPKLVDLNLVRKTYIEYALKQHFFDKKCTNIYC